MLNKLYSRYFSWALRMHLKKKKLRKWKTPRQKSFAWHAVVALHNGPCRRLDFRHPLVSGLRWAPLTNSDR